MKEQIALLQSPAPKASTEAIRDFTQAAPDMVEPKKFTVELPHAPAATVVIETFGVREIDWRDRAWEAYRQHMGVSHMGSIHTPSVVEA